MAGFVEVMKTARRMCSNMECDVCPLFDAFNEHCFLTYEPLCQADSDLTRCEAAIVKWATENPELRFPTWHEWANEQFPDADDGMRTCAFISKERANCMAQDTCDDCRNQPIPADIAQKLGIQPIPVEPETALVDEYERLRGRAENLNLYLNKLHQAEPWVFAAVKSKMSGMPGYVEEKKP